MDIKLVKKLRDNSGASMSLVKTCLEDASWDYDAASILLQKKLGVGSVKREQNQTHFGVVALHVSFDRRTGTLLAVNCETDFVARNSQFVEFAQREDCSRIWPCILWERSNLLRWIYPR